MNHVANRVVCPGRRRSNYPPPTGGDVHPSRPGQTAPSATWLTQRASPPPPPPPPSTIPPQLPAPTNKGGLGSLAASPPPCTPPKWAGPRSPEGRSGGAGRCIPRLSVSAPPARRPPTTIVMCTHTRFSEEMIERETSVWRCHHFFRKHNILMNWLVMSLQPCLHTDAQFHPVVPIARGLLNSPP